MKKLTVYDICCVDERPSNIYNYNLFRNLKSYLRGVRYA